MFWRNFLCKIGIHTHHLVWIASCTLERTSLFARQPHDVYGEAKVLGVYTVHMKLVK